MSDRDPLAELNEHFARFMQHADGLLREWKSAIDEQTKNLQTRVEREVDAQLNESVRHSLVQLRAEMDRLTARRPGGPVAAMPQPEARSRSLILGALVSANVLLLVVIGLQVNSCNERADTTAPGAAPTTLAVDAGVRTAPPARPDAAIAAVALDAAVPDAAAPPKQDKKSRKSTKKKKKSSSKKRKKSAK